ncbi:MAG: electron transfer flavoprotein subunit beta/FixA family protein [Bacteroidales bacterium]
MSFRIIVLAKQVPDTRDVGKDAMKADGTVNRSALPAIFNPEDLHALEQALRIKEQRKDAEIILLTMGPPRAAEIIREALYRGADKGYLLTDRKFAGSDTLATSYTLAQAIRKMEPYNLVIAGRQAIDGDTAQVGPQIGDKLDLPQVTYTEEITSIKDDELTIKRRLDRGTEVVSTPLPALLTIHSSAANCRPRNAKLLMKFKNAKTVSELQEQTKDYTEMLTNKPYLQIDEWGASDIDTNPDQLGLSGSPTKVKKIENVVLAAKESVILSSEDKDIDRLMKELIESHVIG